MVLMKSMYRSRLTWLATAMAVMAGVVYNSWPLGFWLNPKVSFGGGLASELEGLHQPYNWLFVLLDIVAGVLVVLAVVILWRRRMRMLAKAALVNFGLFGLFTIVDALLPMPCEPSVAVCPVWYDQPMLILHGVASIGAAVTLFASAAIVWHIRRTHKDGLMMRMLMAGWAVFGILSLVFFLTPGPGYLSQDYYLILCGIWVAVMPAMLRSDLLQPKAAYAVAKARD